MQLKHTADTNFDLKTQLEHSDKCNSIMDDELI